MLTAADTSASSVDAAVGHVPDVTDARRQTVSNTLITGTSQGVVLAISIATIATLARLLTPADYGLVAMVLGAMAFVRPLSDAGLSIATIQTERLTHAQLSNLFWINAALGAALAALLAAAAPLIASFYQEPRVVSLAFALSVSFILLGMSVQHMALLKRQMKFTSIAAIEIGSAAAGLIAGLATALAGMGYWSLVFVQLAPPTAMIVGSWLVSGWRPGLPRQGVGTRPLVSFGASLTASSFLWALARGGDSVLIGRVLGLEALGLYSRAISLINRPIEQAAAPLASVFVPTLSRLRTSPEVFRNAARDTHALLAFLSLTAGGLLLPLAGPITALLLGSQWTAASPIVAALSLLVVYLPMTLVPGWILSSQGRGRDFLLLSCINSVLTLGAYVIGLPFGPVGVALAFSLSSLVLQLPVTVYFVGSTGVVTRADLAVTLIKQAPGYAVAYGAAVVGLRLAPDAAPVLQIALSGILVAIAAIAWAFAYPPSRQVARAMIEIGRQTGMFPSELFGKTASPRKGH
jgi:polysaccharide transporter, PST family